MSTMLKKKASEKDAQLYLTTINFIRLFSVFKDIASEEDAQLHPTTVDSSVSSTTLSVILATLLRF